MSRSFPVVKNWRKLGPDPQVHELHEQVELEVLHQTK